MSRHFDGRRFSNGDYDEPRSHGRRGSFEQGRRGGPRPDFCEDDVFRTLRITNLNPRVSDREVQDAVYREFRGFGEYNVKIAHYGDQRLAFVNFRYAEDAEAAIREFYNRLVLFDMPVRIGPVYPKPPPRGQFMDRAERGYSPSRRFVGEGEVLPRREIYPKNDYFDDQIPPPPPDNIVNRQRHLPPEEDFSATRTLFVGNVDPNISVDELKAVFEEHGYVEDVDIKKPPAGNGNPYAFIRYFNLDMAHAAKVKLSGKFIGPYQCKIGYGKPTPSSCVWIGGVGPWITKSAIAREFERFGTVQRIVWPAKRDYVYLCYDNVESAKQAVEVMRGFRFKGSKQQLRTDFSDPKHMETDLSVRTYSRLSSVDVDKAARSRRMTGSRSLSASSDRSGGRSRSSNDGSLRKHRKQKSRDSHQITKRHRTDSVEQYSAEPFSGHGAKRRRRSRSASNASLESDRMKYRFQTNRVETDNIDVHHVTTIHELSENLPVIWSGFLSLKNNKFFVNFHSVMGSPVLVDMLLCDSKRTKISHLKLTQRLRMDPPKLDEVRRRIQLAGNDWSVLLALPSSSDKHAQDRPLKNLVSYLRQKEAAGVLSLPPDSVHGKETGLLHAFAPCGFAHQYLLQRAPNLDLDAQAENYVVIILVRVNI